MNTLGNIQEKNNFSQTEKHIIRIITKTSSLEGMEVGEFSRLVDDLHLNSLDTYEIFMNLETDFGIDIPKFMSKNVSIKNLADYIDATLKRHMANKSK